MWGPPLAVMAVIFVLSSMTQADQDRGLLYLIVRKAGHFSEYALLAALWWRALATRLDPRRALALAYAVAVVYAASDEFHQTFVRGRDGTPRDVLIDAAGAALAAFLIHRSRIAPRRAATTS